MTKMCTVNVMRICRSVYILSYVSVCTYMITQCVVRLMFHAQILICDYYFSFRHTLWKLLSNKTILRLKASNSEGCMILDS